MLRNKVGLVSVVFIFLYVLVGLVPYLESVDKRYIQTLYLSILNTFSFISVYLIYNKKFIGLIADKLKSLPLFLFLIFFFWSLLSIINTINIGEYIIQSNLYFQQLLSFIFIFYFLSNIKRRNELLKVVILSILSLEIITSYYPYINQIIVEGKPTNRNIIFRGFTGSVNMISYTMLMKLPFIFYYTVNSKKWKFLYLILSTLILYDIFYVFQTRSAIIVSIIISTLFFCYLLYYQSILKLSLLKRIKNSLVTCLLPLILCYFIGNTASNFFETRDFNERISSLNTDDRSVSSRLRFYKHAIETISQFPVFGIGNGNWEIISIDKDSKYMQGYTVPYHVHNDFLEIAAESGIIGGIIYYGFILYVLFLLLREILKVKKLDKEKLLNTALLLSILVYLFDSFFNFPTSRPYQQITFLFIIGYSIIKLKNRVFHLNFSFKKIFIYLFLILTPISIYISSRVYKSAVEQNTLLRFYNFARTDLPENLLDNMELDFPSVTSTTIPLKSMKAFFLFKNKNYEEAKTLFHEGKKYNPYLKFEEAWLSQMYYVQKDYDSAKYYGKIAYNKIPNNILHFAHYMQSMMRLKDTIEMKDLYDNHQNKTENHNELFLTAIAAVIDKDENDITSEYETAVNTDLSKKAFYTLRVGYENTMKAGTFHLLAEEYFKNEEFDLALVYWDQARNLNPFELPYQENLATTLIRLQEYNEALNVLNQLIDNPRLESKKPYYLRGLVLYQQGEVIEGCKDLKIAYEKGLLGSTNIYEQLCNK